jgi:hypothetical protein
VLDVFVLDLLKISWPVQSVESVYYPLMIVSRFWRFKRCGKYRT